MTDEIRYKVGVMSVTFEEAPEGEPRPWDSFECECEEFAKKQANPMLQTIAEKKCRHIREAEMYHIYREKVQPVENE